MVQATAARCADCIFTAQIILCCSSGWKWNEAVSEREGVKFNNRSVRSPGEMCGAVWTVPALSCLDLPQKCPCVGDPITEHVLREPFQPIGRTTNSMISFGHQKLLCFRTFCLSFCISCLWASCSHLWRCPVRPYLLSTAWSYLPDCGSLSKSPKTPVGGGFAPWFCSSYWKVTHPLLLQRVSGARWKWARTGKEITPY